MTARKDEHFAWKAVKGKALNYNLRITGLNPVPGTYIRIRENSLIFR